MLSCTREHSRRLPGAPWLEEIDSISKGGRTALWLCGWVSIYEWTWGGIGAPEPCAPGRGTTRSRLKQASCR